MLSNGPMHKPGAERRRAERGSHRKTTPCRQGVQAKGSQRPHREVIDWRVMEHDEGRIGDTAVHSRSRNEQGLLPDNAFAVVETKWVAHGVEGVAQVNRRSHRQDADEQHHSAKHEEQSQSSAIIHMSQGANPVRFNAAFIGFLAHDFAPAARRAEEGARIGALLARRAIGSRLPAAQHTDRPFLRQNLVIVEESGLQSVELLREPRECRPRVLNDDLRPLVSDLAKYGLQIGAMIGEVPRLFVRG